MGTKQTDPAAALQAVLSESNALRKENRELKKLLVEVSELIARYLESAKQLDPPELDSIFSREVRNMELSVKSKNCLDHGGIQSINELVANTEAELLRMNNLGRRSLSEIKDILGRMGLKLGMTQEDKVAWSMERAKDKR